ncbi:MAG: beta-ketoacyl-ACP synthase II [Bacteroidales bacterium]|nr:beta-ketoacyl-ACP synthase II [Bacteroidales bacterium]
MELKRVVVTGLGALTPLGNNVPDFWQGLIAGKNGVGLITHFNAESYKTRFACELKGFNVLDYMDEKNARKLDPCAHYAYAAGVEALRDSGIDMASENPDRAGVIVASGIGGIQSAQDGIAEFAQSGGNPRFSPFFILRALVNMPPAILSIRLGLQGPNYALSSACASAANAIVDAYHLIRLGKADIMLSGGTEAAILESGIGGFNAMRALSTRNDDFATASRPLSAGRDGFVMGEGAGILVLEELEHARARGAKIYGEIIGDGLSADAYHITSPHPDGHGAAVAMRNAIADAGLRPEDIDYINMHATSTQMGDRVECLAIQQVFGEHANQMFFSSTKSMTGHLLGACGAIESIAVVLSLQNSILPPTINFIEKDPGIPDWNFCANGAICHDIRYAINNAFGFGGHNVSILFKKFED